MKHTGISRYVTRAWDSTGWTTVYQHTETIVSNGWANFVFDTPFDYNGTNNLIIDFSFDNSSYTFDGVCRVTPTPDARALTFRSDSNDGDPLMWQGTTPTPFANNFVPNIKLSAFQPP